MKITFDVAERSALFHQDPWLGGASLLIDGRKTTLASLRDRGTYFTCESPTTWSVRHGEHTIQIERSRSRMSGGVRPSTDVVRVDGKEITNAQGY
jgi:hypothetical protein